MFDVPQKFYELCRLCLSLDGVKYSIFEEGDIQENFAKKISTWLSITVSVLWFVIKILLDATICNIFGADVYAFLRCVVLIVAVLLPSLSPSPPLLARLLGFKGALARARSTARLGVVHTHRFSLTRTLSCLRSRSYSCTADRVIARVCVCICACHERKFGKRCAAR